MNKNENVLGSVFEMALRILLILDELAGIKLDEQTIRSVDFIALYAADFNLLDENLHGYSSYRYSEYSARKSLVEDALKNLVLNGTVSFFLNQNGFVYRISKPGRDVCRMLTGSYAEEYRISVKAISKKYDLSTAKALLEDINHHTIRSLQEVYDE